MGKTFLGCCVALVIHAQLSKHQTVVEGVRTVEIRVDKLNALDYRPPNRTCCFAVECACATRVQACLFDQVKGTCLDEDLRSGPDMGGLVIGRTPSLLFLDTNLSQENQDLGLRIVFIYGPNARHNYSILGHYRLDIKGLPLGPNSDEVGWTTFDLNTATGVTSSLQVKTYCGRNHFGRDCSRRCVPVADQFYCSPEGNRKCLGLWTGPRCDKLDPCLSFPCLNAGTCHHTQGTAEFTCQCNPLYTGRDCSMGINSCSSVPCHQTATCVDLLDGYRCMCPLDRTGTHCEKEIDDCQSHGCQNRGRCSRTTSSLHATAFQCICPRGYSGERCEVSVCNVNTNSNNNNDDNNNNNTTTAICQHGGRCLVTGSNSFRCRCTSGFTGIRCEKRKIILPVPSSSPCDLAPCQNGGKCVIQSGGNDYTCLCKDTGYKGNRCRFRDPCASQPCRNNGICLSDSSGQDVKCQCLPAFTGRFCSETDPCFQNPCLNGGICSPVPDGEEYSVGWGRDTGRRAFNCSCQRGYSGRLCEVANPCRSQPCSNGGVCRSTTTDTGSFHSFSCACRNGYIGHTCDVYDSDSCLGSNPCRNGGTCVPKNRGQGFFCQCLVGHHGDKCEIASLCLSRPCQNGGSCVPTNQGQGYFCQCSFGYKGNNCQVVSRCLSNPCLNGGSCRDSPFLDSYSCSCPPGFFGRQCELGQLASSTNPCLTLNNPCGEHGTCNVCKFRDQNCAPPSSFSSQISPRGRFKCVCSDGYTGSFCDKRNFCLANPPVCQNGGRCVPVNNNTHICQCPSGVLFKDCRRQSMRDLALDSCSSSPCLNNGVCTSIYSSKRFVNSLTPRDSRRRRLYYSCTCPPGFTGTNCDLIDNCFVTPCLNGGRCRSRMLGNNVEVACRCVRGYTGAKCETKIALSCEIFPCQNNGRCVVSYVTLTQQTIAMCSCPRGFTGDFCERASDCREIPCLNNGVCREGNRNIDFSSSMDGMVCACPRGFVGKRCQTRIAQSVPCGELVGSCLNGGVCETIVGLRDSGEQRSPARFSGSGIVDGFSSSSVSPIGSRCACRPGFTGTWCESAVVDHHLLTSGSDVSIEFEHCMVNPCQNGGRCIREIRDGSKVRCECLKGWTGQHCHIWEGRRGLCLGVHCSGRGVCYQGNDNKPVCQCHQSFGRQCEHSCSGRRMGDLFPHPTDCRQYVVCAWGIPYAMRCPRARLHFNPRLGLCDWPSRAGCDDTDNTRNDDNDDDEGAGVTMESKYGAMWWRVEV